MRVCVFVLVAALAIIVTALTERETVALSALQELHARAQLPSEQPELARQLAKLGTQLRLQFTGIKAASPSVRLPIVFGHGMGDSCFNDGMIQITNETGVHQGHVYC